MHRGGRAQAAWRRSRATGSSELLAGESVRRMTRWSSMKRSTVGRSLHPGRPRAPARRSAPGARARSTSRAPRLGRLVRSACRAPIVPVAMPLTVRHLRPGRGDGRAGRHQHQYGHRGGGGGRTPIEEFFGEEFFRRFFGDTPEREPAAQPRLGRDRRSVGHRAHQRPRGRAGHRDRGRHRSTARSTRPSWSGVDKKTDLAVLRLDDGGHVPVAPRSGDSDKMQGRRLGDGHRLALRAAADGDGRHHQRQGRAQIGQGALRRLPPDRRRHQSRQLRRPAREHAGRGGRHQHRHPVALGRQCRHRLRHSRQHGPADLHRAGGQGQGHARLARRVHPAAHPRAGQGLRRSRTPRACSSPTSCPTARPAKAGLQAGDIIIEFDGQEDGSAVATCRASSRSRPRARACPSRSGGTRARRRSRSRSARRPTRRVALKSQQARARSHARPRRPPDHAGDRPAAQPAQRRRAWWSPRVDEDSAAAEAGVQRGDVIREINRQRVRALPDFERVTKDVKEGDRAHRPAPARPACRLYVAFTVAEADRALGGGLRPPSDASPRAARIAPAKPALERLRYPNQCADLPSHFDELPELPCDGSGWVSPDPQILDPSATLQLSKRRGPEGPGRRFPF